MSDPQCLTVLVASPLQAEHVARIAAAEPDRIRVIYEPTLLPAPRSAADHDGVGPDLDQQGIATWRAHLASADILFDFDWFEPECLTVNAPKVKWVQATSAGIGEYLARTGLARADVVFTTAAGVHAIPLAEHVALGLLYMVKSVPKLRAWQAAHHWEAFTTEQLAGRRMLLIGLGHVGRQIALTCAGLELEVWGIDPRATEPPGGVSRLVARTDLCSSLSEVDVLVLSCPYTAETHHLIGAEELAAMRSSAFVINVARGAVIDEPALVNALRADRLSGAVLDVFEEEPLPESSPLWDMPNVLITPHSVSTVAAENGRITDLFIDNLQRYLAGEPLLNVFVPSRGF